MSDIITHQVLFDWFAGEIVTEGKTRSRVGVGIPDAVVCGGRRYGCDDRQRDGVGPRC